MTVLKRIQAAWNAYLKRLAKENKDSFSGGKPDCCSMNSQKKK